MPRAIWVSAVAASLVLAACRSQGPVLGNTVISIPVIATASPIGSNVAYAAMHLAAVTHAYESKDRLPPQVFVRQPNPRQ